MGHNSEAVRLAEASDWKGLQRLIELAPERARECGDYGMLPIHWACTESHVPVALLDRLLTAYPDGARTKSAVHLLPLHIAIRARAQPPSLRRLLAANPFAVRVPTPDGLSVLELADKAGLSSEAKKVLLDATAAVAALVVSAPAASPEQDDASDDGDDDNGNNNNNRRSSGKRTRRRVTSPSSQELQDALLTKRTTTTSQTPQAVVRSADSTDSKKRSQLLHSHSDGDDALRATTTITSNSNWPPQLRNVSRLPSTDTSDAVGSPLSDAAESFASSHDDDQRLLLSRSSSSASSTSTTSHPRSPASDAASDAASDSPPPPAPLHKQMAGPFERKHSLEYLHRTHAAVAAASKSAPTLQHHPQSPYDHRRLSSSSPKRSRNQRQSRSAVPFEDPAAAATAQSMPTLRSGGSSRHQSLPDVPSFRTRRSNDATRDNFYRSSYGDDGDADATDAANVAAPSGLHRVHAGSVRLRHEFDAAVPEEDSHVRNAAARFESPPTWQQDDECAICRVAFGMFKHRHHCRNCGQSICSQHSADRKVSIAAKGFKTPQRVCVTCYAALVAPQYASSSPPTLFTGLDALLDAANVHGPNPVAAFALQHLQPNNQQSQSPSRLTGCSGSNTSPSGAADVSGSPNGFEQALRRDLAAQTFVVHELRAVVAAQHRQIDALVQTTAALQQHVREDEDANAATTLLITELMTRVSVLELQRNDDASQRSTNVDVECDSNSCHEDERDER